jgi:hypothetical protein
VIDRRGAMLAGKLNNKDGVDGRCQRSGPVVGAIMGRWSARVKLPPQFRPQAEGTPEKRLLWMQFAKTSFAGYRC